MKRTISHGSYTTTIESDLEIHIKKLEQFEKKFGRVTLKHATNFAIKPMIKYVKKLIQDGGSAERKFSWGYWERKGGGEFRYYKGKIIIKGKTDRYKKNFFSNSLTTSRKVQRFPIHPKFYFLRKVRRKPKTGEFALIDTGAVLKGFMILNQSVLGNQSQITLGNIDKKFMIHEFGKGVPKRVMLAPTVDWYENNRKLKEDMINAILKEFEKI